MAIGTPSNSSNDSNKLYEKTYYSRFKIKNQNSKLSLGFSFRSGLLIIEIDEVKEGFKTEPVESIYLSPTKALLLSYEIKKYKNYIKDENAKEGIAFGVNAGMNEKVSYIGFHLSKDRSTLITIGKMDGSGTILEQVDFELNKDYHFGLEWNDIRSMDVNKVSYDSIELDQITFILEDFAKNMSGALAYSVADLTRYDYAGIMKKMDPIYDKMGIERRTSGSGNYKPNNFLSNLGTSNHTTVDDISELLD